MNKYEEIKSTINILLYIVTNIPDKNFIAKLSKDTFDSWPENIDPCCIINQSMKQSIQSDGFERIHDDYITLFIENKKNNDCHLKIAYKNMSKNIPRESKLVFETYCNENDINIDRGTIELNKYIGMLLFLSSEMLSHNYLSCQIAFFSEQYLDPMINLFINQIETNAKTEYYLGIAGLLANLMIHIRRKTKV